MHELIPAAIVHHIADFTSQREPGQLEASLLRAVDDLFSPEWSALFRKSGRDADTSVEFAAASRAGVLEGEAPAGYADLIDKPGVTLLPIPGRVEKLLGYLAIKRAPILDEEEQRLAAALFRIYDNTLCLLREAQFDRLTSLLNRHTFDTQLDRALEMARRTSRQPQGAGKPMRFFLGEIDIDHFKDVNDQYGHLYGDEVLLIVARLLKSNFRKSDLVFRFGGEEFVVIVVAETCEGARLSFERLREKIEGHAFPQVGRITVSAGLTEICETDAPVQILGRADQALYHAKKNGRNRVCFYEALLNDGLVESAQATGDVTIF